MALVAFVGPWLLEGRKQEAERKRKRAEKLEEFITAVHEHQHWLETKGTITVFGGEGRLGLSPLSKVKAISNIYFPEVKEKLLALAAKASAYELWMTQAGQKRLNKEPNFTEGFKDAYGPYFVSLNELLDEAEKLGGES